MSKIRKPDIFSLGWAKEESLKKNKVREVASVAVMKDGKLLMGKRRDNDRWTMPGGHLDEGEHHHDGAKRELKEEAGLEAENLTHLGSEDLTDAKGNPLRVHAYKHEPVGDCSTSMKEDPDQEVHRWHWIDVKDGLPQEIAENLHSPKNVTLKLLGLQKATQKDFIPNTGFRKSIEEKLLLLKTNLAMEKIKKISDDVQAGLRLMHTERHWIKHVTQAGHEVKIDHAPGVVGKVIQGAKDPVNGVGHDRMTLVQHPYNDGIVHRWYPATSLTPHNPKD